MNTNVFGQASKIYDFNRVLYIKHVETYYMRLNKKYNIKNINVQYFKR